MKAYTSRARFDETKNYSGVYQQMGRVSLDSDWNEEVQIRTQDARRRTHDLAYGSPDDGFSISDEHTLDRIDGVRGWTGSGLEPGDLRVIPPVLRLDRRELESLPWVLRAHGHVRVERQFDTPRDLTALPLAPDGSFAAATLVFAVRFSRPANDDDPTAVAFFLIDADGNRALVPAAFGEALPEDWTEQRIPLAAFAGVDATRVRGWGVSGLSPRATSWIDDLRATDAALAADGSDFVVRGGDGTTSGAGRLLIDGVRAQLARDVRYSRQPDLPDPPALAALAADGSDAHVVYLDVWEELVTALDDPFLAEPALDGLDTTVRLRTLAQIKVQQNRTPADPVVLPLPTGGARLTTNVPAGAFPDRYPADPTDPCRDRCLSTESASLGEGYTGSHNLHLRVEIFSNDGPRPVFLWSRDNGSTRLPLAADAAASATTLSLRGEDVQKLRAGDIVVVSDRRIDRQPDGMRRPVLRVVKSADPATGTVMLREAGFVLTNDPAPLAVGGPLGGAFRVGDQAYLRRWDGADYLLENVRYNLPEGFALRFSGNGARASEYWSFTARVENADGAARGVIEQLTDAAVHGPLHHTVALARVTRDGGSLHFEDLRPRFLPLGAVRDRLLELASERIPTGAFTLIVGDGVRTFGDIDQNLLEGVSGDEALQSAVNRLRDGGGTLYIRAGDYRLEKPVLLSGASRLRVLGDGDASALRVVGAGGAFVVDGCGNDGEVAIEMLSLVEAPLEDAVIGIDSEELPEPGEEVAPLDPADLLGNTPAYPTFVESVATSMLAPLRLARRTLNAVRSTLEALRRLQRENPGVAVEDLPAAAPLLAALRQLPHGVVTIGDSRRVRLHRLHIESREPEPQAAGVFLTGTCSEIAVTECRVEAASGIVAVPYGPYLSRTFLAQNVRSGLNLDGVRITGNTIAARGAAVHGIHLADGTLRALEISGNTVAGFALGIGVRDRVDAGTAVSRIAVADNRVTGSSALGIDVLGRSVDLDRNIVANGAPAGLVQAGIRVRGTDVRVRDCDLALPGLGVAPSPLGLIAAIIVGSGADEGVGLGALDYSVVQNVEVAGCRVRGAGAAYPGIGVLIGGPEPVLGVRVRDSDFAELGDAAVRTFGHGGKVGRVRVDSNRITNVARALVPDRADARPMLEELAPALIDPLLAAGVDLADPSALLRALVANPSSSAVAPLDAVLRWVSLRTLRAAVIFDQTDDGEVASNRIEGVGRDGAAGNDVYAAGVALVGGLDISVENNRIQNVISERRNTGDAGGVGGPPSPVAFATLTELELDADERHAERADVHLAAVALRRMILAYAQGDDAERQRLGRRVYGAMDAMVNDLDGLGGAGAKIAASLALEADDMRAAQTRDDHTRAAHRVRASLSRAASITSASDLAAEAWDAASQFDLAVLSNRVAATAARLQDAAGELAAGLPDRRAALERVMAEVIQSQGQLAALLRAAGELATLGEWRDAAAGQSGVRTPADLLGSKRTIVSRFAERLRAEADRLSVDTGSDNRALLESLDADKQTLIDSLRRDNKDLAQAFEVDWRSLERSVTGDRKGRLQATLAKVQAWADGSVLGDEVAGASDVARLGDSGTAALTVLVAKHLDENVERLSTEPEGAKTKSLRILQTAAGQLRNLVGEDPETADLATRAGQAIEAAASDTPSRAAQLATARSLLASIRQRAQVLIPPPPTTLPPSRPLSQGVDRYVAALGAAALALRNAAPAQRATGIALYRAHFVRAVDAARLDGALRSSTLDLVNSALNTLGAATGTARARAVYALVRELDRVLNALPPAARSAGLDPVVVLVHAALLGISPDDDAPTRLLRVQAYLRERRSSLAQSMQQDLGRQSEAEGLLAALQALLERLSRGERPFVPELEAPRFELTLLPADGVFAAAPVGRLRIVGNQLVHAVRGITLGGDAAHPLVGSARTGSGAVLTIADNRCDGCALGGFDVRPSGDVSLALTGNEVFASAGVGEAGPQGVGQAVARLSGSGELVVAANSFHGNGHDHPRALVHELFIDWRGEVVLRGNTVRHIGGGAGGAGVLIAAEAALSDLPRRLAMAPFLGIEPPPPAASDVPRPGTVSSELGAIPVLSQLVRGLVPSASLAEKSSSGRLLQTVATQRVAPRLLTEPLALRPTGLAASAATRYLARGVASPLATVLDFVRPWQYWKPLPLPPPAAQRSYHIEGNDVAARGPALLLVADSGGDVISASVVANSLQSEGGTGAAYVRFAESVVFTANRCQAVNAVNVVVIRALDSAVSVTGNVVVGREPVAPPPPPPKLGPVKIPPRAAASLNLSLGGGAEISVPVDPVKLRGNLEAFSSEARQAFASVLLERAAAEEPFLAPLEVREAGQVRLERALAPVARAEKTSFGQILELGTARFALSPFTGPQNADTVFRYINENKLGSRDVEALMRGTDLVAFESDAAKKVFIDQVDLYRKSKKLEELAEKKPVDEAVERSEASRVFQRVGTQTDTQAGALAEMAQIFTAQGFNADRTSAEVKALIQQSSGDATKALGTLKNDILAIDAASVPARRVLDNTGLLEKILVDGLISGGDAIAEVEETPAIVAPVRPGPDPYTHSLVVLGGAVVTTVGNASSAGSLVLGAAETVELNV